MMERSRERAESLLVLISDLLTMSRIDAKRVERYIKPVDVNGMILENLDFFKGEVTLRNRKLL